MKPSHRLLLAFAFACPCLPTVALAEDQIHLNEDAVRFAQQLIANGDVVADKKGAWTAHRPSVDDENQFIHTHGISEYAQWHLGIDPRRRENSKARFKFPFGDFQSIHRCALIAIRNRAREHGYSEIEKTAAELQREVEQKAKAAR